MEDVLETVAVNGRGALTDAEGSLSGMHVESRNTQGCCLQQDVKKKKKG